MTWKSEMTPSLSGSDGDDVGRGTADHALGLGADRKDLFGDSVDRDDARLIDDDAAALDHDQRVGGAKVDSHVMREQTQKRANRVEGHATLAFRNELQREALARDPVDYNRGL